MSPGREKRSNRHRLDTSFPAARFGNMTRSPDAIYISTYFDISSKQLRFFNLRGNVWQILLTTKSTATICNS